MNPSAPKSVTLSEKTSAIFKHAWIVFCTLPLTTFGAEQKPVADKGTPVEWQWGVKIPLRDGVKLNATLYRPRDQREPQPCIFTLTPYISANYHDRGMYFGGHGYVFLTVDARGRGNSEGSFTPLLQEAKDGHDIVEWLAAQPFCNGKVGMWGGSYAGYNQWVTAKERPPHLAVIAPAAAPFAGADFPMTQNMPYPYNIQWLTLITGRASQERIFADSTFWIERFRELFVSHRPFAELDRLVGNPSPIFQEMVAHPRLDEHWDAYNPTAADYAAIDLPILTITGHYDGNQGGAFEHYRQHMRHASASARSRHFLIIGPWDHAQTRTPTDEVGGLKLGEASVLDLNKLHREWYDWALKAGAKPEFLKKPVSWYVMGAEAWRYADSLEAVTRESRVLYLASDHGYANDAFHSGRLQSEVLGKSVPDRYVYDPLDVSGAELQAVNDALDLKDQREVLLAGGKALIYHTTPFERDTEVSGFFRLSAWIDIDQADTDFAAAVYEILPDGSSVLLSSAVLRARYRESLRAEKLIPRGEVLEYRLNGFSFVARQIDKGSRLRLVFGPVNSIYAQKNYNSGGVVAEESGRDARKVTVRLYHDGRYPSALYVPIGASQ